MYGIASPDQSIAPTLKVTPATCDRGLQVDAVVKRSAQDCEVAVAAVKAAMVSHGVSLSQPAPFVEQGADPVNRDRKGKRERSTSNSRETHRRLSITSLSVNATMKIRPPTVIG